MKQPLIYEALGSIPVYGAPAIAISGNNAPFYSEGFVVRFYKSDGTSWLANFEPGWTSLNRVIELSHPRELLVISGGRCYIMNPDHEQPIEVFGIIFRQVIECHGIIVLMTNIDITVIKIGQQIWNSERISWNGMKDVAIMGHILTGLAYDSLGGENDWVPFMLDLKELQLTGGSFNKYDFKPTPKRKKTQAIWMYDTIAEKKKWWRFW